MIILIAQAGTEEERIKHLASAHPGGQGEEREKQRGGEREIQIEGERVREREGDTDRGRILGSQTAVR